jgi:hypothetical protein
VGLVKKGIPGYPAGSDIGGSEGEDILAGSGLSAMMDDVNLDKTGEYTLQRGVEGADRDVVFEEVARFGERFAFEGEGGLMFFKGTVDGSGTYGQEFNFDIRGDTEGRAEGDSVYLLPYKGGQYLRTFDSTAFIPKEGPDEAEGSDDLIGIDFFTGTVGGFFLRLEFDRLAFDDGEGLRRLRLIEDTQGVLSVFVTGNLDGFVEDCRLLFPSGM